MKIQILGAGCQKCKALTENVEKVTDLMEIMKAGVLSTPALMIDGEIKAVAKLLSPKEIADLVR